MPLAPKTSGDSTARDHLALMRTHMANERTLLAYFRTALMLIATGGTMLKLLADTLPLQLAGWGLIVFGIMVVLLGIRRYRRYQRQFSFGTNAAES